MEKNNVKALIFASIISADNTWYSEEVKQEIIRRYDISDKWEFILEPIPDKIQRDKLIDILNTVINEENDNRIAQHNDIPADKTVVDEAPVLDSEVSE